MEQSDADGLAHRGALQRPRGRTVSQAEAAELREKIVELERELKASHVREELAVVMPAVVKKKMASLPQGRRPSIRRESRSR